MVNDKLIILSTRTGIQIFLAIEYYMTMIMIYN